MSFLSLNIPKDPLFRRPLACSGRLLVRKPVRQRAAAGRSAYSRSSGPALILIARVQHGDH